MPRKGRSSEEIVHTRSKAALALIAAPVNTAAYRAVRSEALASGRQRQHPAESWQVACQSRQCGSPWGRSILDEPGEQVRAVSATH